MFRKTHHKIASFSLVEMLIVLVLSSIVTGILYLSYYTVNRYHHDLTERFVSFGERSELFFLLKQDFDKSADIRKTSSTELTCYQNDGRLVVQYRFDSQGIVRVQESRHDSFRCTVLDVQMNWMRDTVKLEPPRVEILTVALDASGDTLRLNFIRDFDRAALIITETDSLP